MGKPQQVRGSGDFRDPNEVARESAASVSANRIAAVVSAIALIFSAYSLWETSLKKADVRVFVPPVIHFSSPGQNTNFEVVEVPITVANEGARTGTILAMYLLVTDTKSGNTKRFYAADLGRWSPERKRSGALKPFAPIALAGRTSRSETVLFYTQGDEKVMQVIRELGRYRFKLMLEVAEDNEWGVLDRLWPSKAPEVGFEAELKYYDARAFIGGSIPLFNPSWRSSSNAGKR